MTVNISKQLLGMACIVAGAFIPLILCTLNWLPTGFDPADAAEFIHLTTPLLLTVMAITVLVNVRESSEARGRGETSLEQLPRNAATLLTGAVGMLLLFAYLIEATNSPSRISSTAALFVYAMTGTVLLMEAEGSQGPRSYRFSAQRVRPTSRRKPGEIHWGSYRRNLDGSEPRYYLSDAPEDTPLETLAYVGGSRWRIETEFETEKSDVGLDEYETRTWAGWHHHVALCLLAGAFLRRGNGRRRRFDPLPGRQLLH